MAFRDHISPALSSFLRHHSAPIPPLSNPFREAAFWQSRQARWFSRTHEIAIIAAEIGFRPLL